MTVIYLLRHGEHAQQGRTVAGRMPGIGLSARGRAEAEAVAARLADSGVVAIYASPLERARETAGIVGERLGLEPRVRDDLVEVDFGDWTGSTFDAVRRHADWPLWANQRSTAAIPGGESARDVQRRVVEAMIELSRSHPDDSIVLVSHGDVIRAALTFALGMPLEFLTRIEVATGSLNTLRLDKSGFRIIGINERARV